MRIRTLAFLSALLLTAGMASAERYEIKPGEPNLIKFLSKATLESFEGKTRGATGYVVANPADLSDSVDVYVEADMASLDTGIGLRNQHMRSNHLETDKYPKAAFHGRKLIGPSQPALAPGKTVGFKVDGEFSLHGVTLPVQIPADVTLSADPAKPGLFITCRFEVKLSDYKIPLPQFLVMKLNQVQTVELALLATPAP